MASIKGCTLFAVLASILASALCSLQSDGIIIEGPGPGPLDILYSKVDGQQIQPQYNYYSGAQPQGQFQPQAGTAVNINLNIADPNKKTQNLDNLLKLGIVLSTIDMYKDEIAHVFERNNELIDKTKLQLHPPPTTEYMVEIVNGNFMTGGTNLLGNSACRTFSPSGTNKYELVEAGAGAPILYDGIIEQRGLVGPEVVRRVMSDAKELGLTFVRFNAFSVTPSFPAISSYNEANGIVLNEALMKGLDYVVEQARINGLKVILVLTDYFAPSRGSPLEYMQYAAISGSDAELKASFYGNMQAKDIFKAYVSALTNRVNTLNGRLYRQDPTIMAWDIMNEPRCDDETICSNVQSNYISSFVNEMYNFLKLGTPAVQQLVTVGTEGFFSTTPYAGIFGTGTGVNPLDAPSTNLADFPTLCNEVDFCEFNVYPDKWGRENEPWVKAWVAAHSDIGLTLGKPVIVKELGMQPTKSRRELFKIMYDSIYNQIVSDLLKVGGLKGAAYWQAWARGTEAVFYTLAPGGRFGILPTDPETHLIRQFSWKLGEFNKKTIAAESCPIGLVGASLVLPPPECPKGYAGVGCEDINECLLGTDSCSINAACENTLGSYKCHCHPGFHGNGKICIALPISLAKIEHGYYTKNKLSCIAGSVDVPYPQLAPGWVEDPSRSCQFSSSANVIPVSLTECKIACHLAEECTSFYYDPMQGSCILKKNQCPYTQSSIPGCASNECGRPECDAPNVSICEKQIFQENSAAMPTGGTYECTRGVTYYKKGVTFSLYNAACLAPVPP